MIVPFGQDPTQLQLAVALHELESCNEVTRRNGLSLSTQDVTVLATGRLEALDIAGRVEFGGGITRELVLGFCGSPHVCQDTFVQTVLDLQELFYDFKNESLEQIADDDLIETMRSLYDEVAQGDMEMLAEALFEGLRSHVHAETLGCDEADLVARRINVVDWTDARYAPAWEGSSWLDE